MIVYGDAARFEPIDRSVDVLRLMIGQALVADPRPAGLRGLLERAGELEQALFDSPESLGPASPSRLRALAGIRRASSWIAAAFDHAYDRSPEAPHSALARARRALLPLAGRSGPVRIAVPEGFAFHALYPESYREAAIRWAEDHPSARGRDVLVVGVRTIGTTLSAVVAATLRSRGFAVRRTTVRPVGDPSRRRLETPAMPSASYGLVVDEGPGRSGSTIHSVADAMRRAGVKEISVISAHERGPGSQASPESRSSWEGCRQYPANAAPLRFEGRTLAEELWTGVRPAVGGELERSIDLSGGAWRPLLYDNRESWPAVCRDLERPKILCVSRDGGRVLFKFSGISSAPGFDSTLANATARRAALLAAGGYSPRLLGEAHGFLAWDWVDGRPLAPENVAYPILARIGGYIALAAGPPLDADEANAARARLDAMLLANTRECLGATASEAAAAEIQRIRASPGTKRAGDGHLAPHEWIRERNGTVLKVDVGGHESDPTWTGDQRVEWDLAAAAAEWDLHGEKESALLRAYTDGGGAAVAPDIVHFYRLAYTAHRAGQLAQFAKTETDEEERGRLERSYGRWREELELCLAGPAARQL